MTAAMSISYGGEGNTLHLELEEAMQSSMTSSALPSRTASNAANASGQTVAHAIEGVVKAIISPTLWNRGGRESAIAKQWRHS